MRRIRGLFGNILILISYRVIEKQIKELEKTINFCPVEVVVSGTSIDLNKIIKVNKPVVRVKYELKPKGQKLKQIVESFIKKLKF